MKRASFLLAGGVLFLGVVRGGAQPAPTVPAPPVSVSTNTVVIPNLNPPVDKTPSFWDTVKSLQFRPIKLPKLDVPVIRESSELDEEWRPLTLLFPEQKKKPKTDWLVNAVDAKIKEESDQAAAKTPAQVKALENRDYQQQVQRSLGSKSPLAAAFAQKLDDATPSSTPAPNVTGEKSDAFGTEKTKVKLSLFSEYTTSGIEVADLKKQSMTQASSPSKSDPDELNQPKPLTAEELAKLAQPPSIDLKTDLETGDFGSLDSLGKPNTTAFSALTTIGNSSNEEVLDHEKQLLLPPQPTNLLEIPGFKPTTLLPAPTIKKEIYKPPTPFPKEGMSHSKVPDPNDILDKP